MTILFVAVLSFICGVGLTYLMMGALYHSWQNREIYPALSSSVPVCAPSRHNQLTGAYQDDTQDDFEAGLYAAGLADEIETLERDAHEYRMEIRRLRDELAAARTPAPVVATPSRYDVTDRFQWLEVAE